MDMAIKKTFFCKKNLSFYLSTYIYIHKKNSLRVGHGYGYPVSVGVTELSTYASSY
jgi:hypothetical protein